MSILLELIYQQFKRYHIITQSSVTEISLQAGLAKLSYRNSTVVALMGALVHLESRPEQFEVLTKQVLIE